MGVQVKGMTWRRAIGWILSLAILIFLVRTLWASWDQVAQNGLTFQFDFPLLIISILLLVPGRIFGVEAWRRILGALGNKISLRFAVYAWFVSNLARFIPGNVWQVAAMMMLTDKAGVSKLNVVLSQAVYAVIALSVAALYGLTLVPLPVADIPLLVLAFVALIVLFALPSVFQLMLKFSTWALRLIRHNQTITVPSNVAITFWQGLIPPLCSFIFWTINGLAFWLFVRSTTDISPTAIPAFIGMNAAAYFVGYVSFITPSGLGFREGALAILLGAFFPAPLAIALSFATRIWSLVGEFLGVGFSVLMRPKEIPISELQAPISNSPSSVARPPSQ
jgi:hypothetical protein